MMPWTKQDDRRLLAQIHAVSNLLRATATSLVSCCKSLHGMPVACKLFGRMFGVCQAACHKNGMRRVHCAVSLQEACPACRDPQSASLCMPCPAILPAGAFPSTLQVVQGRDKRFQESCGTLTSTKLYANASAMSHQACQQHANQQAGLDPTWTGVDSPNAVGAIAGSVSPSEVAQACSLGHYQ